jgi:hypothetical protein
MSEPITDLVFERGPRTHNPRIILLWLGFCVELRREYKDFYDISTSIAELVERCRLSESGVRRALKQLSEEGWLEVIGEQKAASASWTARLNLKKLSAREEG